MSTVLEVERAKRKHPLQRLDSPSKGFSGALHNDSFGGHFQYLTIIGLTICTLSFACGIIADITNSRTFFLLKNYLSLTAAPLELLISLLYWSLRLIDTSLVIPPDLPMLPLATDLTFHLFPAIFLSLDALLLSPPWPTSPVNPNAPLVTLAMSTVLAFAYWFWIEVCYERNGFYPYPIFALLGLWQRVGLFLGSAVTMWVVGGGLRAVYAYVNGFERVEGKRD
ncbi:hypothetical protein BU24DRAFT_461984 [Aaosphaeria arxii CBS 175.79]|uniref:FAR-17a/AIG1-like protein n=1 Tax=Aaosphaeria arxii CBS 175.79 TaxID=1450172 RepID=A0A6A5XS37_9PLEO|nr:uncharacterized protein BU24DRAFT_461984 [Aaosphaeria arxii CBS 175.79]KAF2015753.1 hypothetical protein BU24DRAFT_461984 [Aaosphaeria arxii CBS 175.79]